MKEQFALLLSFVLEFYKILELDQDKLLIDKKGEKKCPDSFGIFGPFTMGPLIGSGVTEKPKEWIQC